MMNKDAVDKNERLRRMLIEARLGAGLRQADVAAKLGKPQSYVSKIERGEQGITIIELIEMAEAVGFEPSSFLFEFINRAAQV